MEEGDPNWQVMTDTIANLAVGSWSLLVLTAIIMAVKRLLPMSVGLKRLVYALLAPPFYLVGGHCYQAISNDLTPNWPIYKFSEGTHLMS